MPAPLSLNAGTRIDLPPGAHRAKPVAKPGSVMHDGVKPSTFTTPTQRLRSLPLNRDTASSARSGVGANDGSANFSSALRTIGLRSRLSGAAAMSWLFAVYTTRERSADQV